jgi:hypothetical protein
MLCEEPSQIGNVIEDSQPPLSPAPISQRTRARASPRTLEYITAQGSSSTVLTTITPDSDCKMRFLNSILALAVATLTLAAPTHHDVNNTVVPAEAANCPIRLWSVHARGRYPSRFRIAGVQVLAARPVHLSALHICSLQPYPPR